MVCLGSKLPQATYLLLPTQACTLSRAPFWARFCRFSYLLEACLDVNRSVLMTGSTGVGKSVIIAAALEDLSKRKGVVPYTINFSAQTQSVDAQMLMESKLEKKRKTRVHPCWNRCSTAWLFLAPASHACFAVNGHGMLKQTSRLHP
eukprot:1158747-Pelagomonas_calceolata.AAC.15